MSDDQRVRIAGRVFRAPAHLLGIIDKDTSWGAGIEQQELGFVRQVAGAFGVDRGEALRLIGGMERV